MNTTLQINSTKIQLSNLERELWPRERLTKYDLIRYYLQIAPYMLPHLKDRFLVLRRFPEGIEKTGFYQKNCPPEAPGWVKRYSFQHAPAKTVDYILAEAPQTLAWLGNQAAVEIHAWLSSLQRPESPDYTVFDLDPMEGTEYEQLCEVALTYKGLLADEGLRCYPKTSGSRGLQLYLPLKPGYSYERSRKFAEAISDKVHKLMPSLTTKERKVSARGKRIYLDCLQNARGKTIVAPYSPRALLGAPVSTPLEWKEVEHFPPPASFRMKNYISRLYAKGDLFAPLLYDQQELPL